MTKPRFICRVDGVARRGRPFRYAVLPLSCPTDDEEGSIFRALVFYSADPNLAVIEPHSRATLKGRGVRFSTVPLHVQRAARSFVQRQARARRGQG